MEYQFKLEDTNVNVENYLIITKVLKVHGLYQKNQPQTLQKTDNLVDLP